MLMLICIAVASADVVKNWDKLRMHKITIGSQDEVVCQSVQSVPLCSELGYNSTSFPNLRGHTSPKEANKELVDFAALIGTGCSNAIVHLLCSIYAPPCMQAYSYLRYPPCRSLCEYVKDGCAATLLKNFAYNWPPNSDLNCSNYERVEHNPLSFCPPNPSTLEIPNSGAKSELFLLLLFF